MRIPYGKTFPFVPINLNLWPWPLRFTFIEEELKFDHNFKPKKHVYFIMCIPCYKTILLVPLILITWHCPGNLIYFWKKRTMAIIFAFTSFSLSGLYIIIILDQKNYVSLLSTAEKIRVGRSAFLFLLFFKLIFKNSSRIHPRAHFTTHELELLLHCQNNDPIHGKNIVWKRKCDIWNICLLKVQ